MIIPSNRLQGETERDTQTESTHGVSGGKRQSGRATAGGGEEEEERSRRRVSVVGFRRVKIPQ